MAAWLAPAISAAGSVISSLFGGKKKTENRVNYKQMVRDAEAAGFNPLTALRNGGAAGYMQTSHPALSTGEKIGGALSSVGNFLADFDPYADQKRELEFGMMQATIDNLNAQTGAIFPPRPGQPGSFNVPSWAATNIEQRPSGRGGRLSLPGTAPLPASAGHTLTPTVEVPTVTNPHPTNSGKVVDPNRPDVEAKQQRYGESEFWEFIDSTEQRIYDWIYNKNYQYDKKIKAAVKRRDEMIDRKRKSRVLLKQNSSFFEKHGY